MSAETFEFPEDLLDSRFEEIVAVGGELSVELLLKAYHKGIFPWPHEGFPMLWFFPTRRGVLLGNQFKVPRSLEKFARKANWTFTWNQCFPEVLKNCQSQVRPGQEGTWITPEVYHSYLNFHRLGHAHSLEVWEGDELIGGIYGVFVDGLFSAESMFFKKSNASKMALLKLCEFLFSTGLKFVDFQMVTPVTESFGAVYISKRQFWKMLQEQKKLAPKGLRLDELFEAWRKIN